MACARSEHRLSQDGRFLLGVVDGLYQSGAGSQLKLQIFFSQRGSPAGKWLEAVICPRYRIQQRTDRGRKPQLESQNTPASQVLQVHRFAGFGRASFLLQLMRAPQAPNRCAYRGFTTQRTPWPHCRHYPLGAGHVASSCRIDVVGQYPGSGRLGLRLWK